MQLVLLWFQIKQGHEDLLTSTFGEEVKQRYLTLAREVDAYCIRLYAEWEHCVGAMAMEKLKQPILRSRVIHRGLREGISIIAARDSGTSASVAAKSSKLLVSQNIVGSADHEQFAMPLPPYGVNFATELHMIIRESKYLDRMGFQVSSDCLIALFFSVSPLSSLRGT